LENLQNDNFLKSLNWNLILGSFGILIAIFFGTYGIYSTIQEDYTNISFEIINEANVLDVHEPVNNLTISFEGEDIQKKNLNIRIITFKVQNVGNVNILQNYYDSNEIWGAQINNSEIIRLRLIESNSEYIKSNLKPKIIDLKTIEFSKTIFEKGDYFTLEILVLHDKGESPTIIPKGKIAGIDKIGVIKKPIEKEDTLIGELFQGDFTINLLRFLIFSSLGELLIFFPVGLFSIIQVYRERRCKKKMVDLALNPIDNENIFSENQLITLRKVLVRIDLGTLRDIIRVLTDLDFNEKSFPLYNTEIDINRTNISLGSGTAIRYLIEKDIIKRSSEGKILPDPMFLNLLRKLESKYRNRCHL